MLVLSGAGVNIDTTAITGALTKLSTAAGPVITAAIMVAVSFFAVPFLWKKVKGAIK